jgi:membrane-bound ClpP family serine protease
MYCSGCGTQLESELNYCNRCGNRVPKGEAMSVAENLSQSVSYVGGFGLLGFIFVTLVLLKKGVPMEAFVPISFFYLTALVVICWLIIRHSSQLTKLRIDARRSGENISEPHYLSPRTTAQLSEPADTSIGSVTEHTTRALDAVPVERK